MHLFFFFFAAQNALQTQEVVQCCHKQSLFRAAKKKYSDFTLQCVSWKLTISLEQIYVHQLSDRIRVPLSIKRSVLFFSSSELMRSAPVFDVQ